jgi:hypothetical protein
VVLQDDHDHVPTQCARILLFQAFDGQAHHRGGHCVFREVQGL